MGIDNTEILVTGASGYIGQRLTFLLSNSGYKVIALCNKNVPKEKTWLDSIHKIIVGDINSKEVLAEIKSISPKYVIHLVSLDHYKSGQDLSETLDVNVLSTWNLIKTCSELNVEKFIYFSTIHVYGFNNSIHLDENKITYPKNIYSLTHKMSEDIVNYYNATTDLYGINLRLSNSYGEPFGNNENSWSLVVNDFCKSAFENNRIVINSDGSDMRDFIHYSTIFNSVKSILRNNKKNNVNVFNLSSGKSISILELAKLVKFNYQKRYHKNVDIFINKSTLVENFSSETFDFINHIPNDVLKENFNFEVTELNEGVNLIFDSFER